MSSENFNKEYSEYLENLSNQASHNYVRKKPNAHTRKRKKRIFIVIRVYLARTIAFLLILGIILGIILAVKSCNKSNSVKDIPSKNAVIAKDDTQETKSEKPSYFCEINENTVSLTDNIFDDFKADENGNKYGSALSSKSVVMINHDTNQIIAARNSNVKAYPASTTKIMTLIVAAEHITDFNDTFTMTYEITDPLYVEGATVAGFSAGEVINMYDLLYGTILPSGGDAAIGLAIKIAGSEAKFAEMMNEKATEMGLKSTHFVNCTGLFNENHYTTAEDMAIIIRYALDNELCKKILSTYKYTTSITDKHPEGILLENTIFKYMYGNESGTASIVGGKTGFVNESGYCIASFGTGNTGNNYVCVTLGALSRWPAIYDQINMYKKFAK